MRVGAIQSNYVPWRGYFDLIRSVDIFVIGDNLQYSTGSYRNRAKLLGENGPYWITVPVRYRSRMPIEAVTIGRPPGAIWQAVHATALRRSLGRAPCFDEAWDIWRAVTDRPHTLLSTLNADLIASVCRALRIDTHIVQGHDLLRGPGRTERIVRMMEMLGARTYLSGPSAKSYLDLDLFRRHGLGLHYKSYDYEPYRQRSGTFVEGLSILDLVANVGTAAASRYLSSLTPDERRLPS